MEPHRLDRAQARRIAIRAQLLDAERPTDLVEAVRHLTFLQVDPTAAIAPNVDLVAWGRLGGSYAPTTWCAHSNGTARSSSSTRSSGRWRTSACTGPHAAVARVSKVAGVASHERALPPRRARPLPRRGPAAGASRRRRRGAGARVVARLELRR